MKVGTDGVLLGAWTETENAQNILEIGTSTGLITLMLAQKSYAKITAIEIDKNSFLQSEINVSTSSWKNRISVKHISLQKFANESKENFDLIVCNPPYFENSLKSPIASKNIAKHNDNLTNSELFAGVEKLLTKNGRFCVIFPFLQMEKFISDISEFGFYCNKKMYVRPRKELNIKRVLMEFNRFSGETKESFLAIENNKRHDYTIDYKKLTKEYYLNF